MNDNDRTTQNASTCLTEGLESLLAESRSPHFDIVIVGSGYGAAMAVDHFSRCSSKGSPLRICLLERGNEFLDGHFPADAAELPGQVRFSTQNSEKARGNLDGLFDLRIGEHLGTLIANGFGGGSLINAGVMIAPRKDVIDNRWPGDLKFEELDFEYCKELLGSRTLAPDELPAKYDELKTIARTEPAHITVAESCTGCGNCATGCNFGHKRSLDRTLFEAAYRRNRHIRFVTGATVEHVLPDGDQGDWTTRVIPTLENARARFDEPIILRSKQVIIAAGTFGSTEILMKSQRAGLGVSPRLGKRFSSNGDMLAMGFDRNREVNAISRSPEEGNKSRANVGPTITGVADYRDSDGILLEEMAVPYPIADLFDEMVTTASTLRDMTRWDFCSHKPGDSDPFALNCGKLRRTSVYALISKDDNDSSGELLPTHPQATGDGNLRVHWPELNGKDVFNRQISFLEKRSVTVGGDVIANPLWKPFPPDLGILAGNQTGPVFSVHPLGGCVMADDAETGVVNDVGQVFRAPADHAGSTSVYSGLAVLDGSIIPTSLGANPALMISAVALRAATKLATEWDYEVNPDKPAREITRAHYRKISDYQRAATKIRVVERMVGDLRIASEDYKLELTCHSEPTAVRKMTKPGNRTVSLGERSRIRIFRRADYENLIIHYPLFRRPERKLNEAALFIATLGGDMVLFPRAESTFMSRVFPAVTAWLKNRGTRDIWQGIFNGDEDEGNFSVSGLIRALPIFAHAGERRTMDYNLKIGEIIKAPDSGNIALEESMTISGQKTIVYARAANPLRQMSELAIHQLGNLSLDQTPVLTLQPDYLAKQGVPLIKIARQADMTTALLDLLSLAGYVFRMLLSIHALTFRLPDAHTRAPMSRLPDRIPGVPAFEQESLCDRAGNILPAVLTRYEAQGGEPVLLMHGYSASGTTFTHESLPHPFAAHLYHQGYDVWVLDARTSPGVPTSCQPWAFEDVAKTDIPVAINHVADTTGQKVHIVAHCMGAGMFSMAVLSGENIGDRINRVVLTQVGPGVIVSPGNTFRAYALAYLKQFINLDRFDFRVDNRSSLADQLIDRLLNVLPYSEADFKKENPAWPPWRRTEWVGIRHRMDMLWGETFDLAKTDNAALDNIDALFGTLNLETLSQVIPISRHMNMTSKEGKNLYFTRQQLKDHWTFETLSLHSERNGLWSPGTLKRNWQFFQEIPTRYFAKKPLDFGHQDIWLSEDSPAVFEDIVDFLKGETRAFCVTPDTPRIPELFMVKPPWIGPLLSYNDNGTAILRYGAGPNTGKPCYQLVLRVNEVEGAFETTVDLDQPDWYTRVTCFQSVPQSADFYRMECRLAPGEQYLVLLIKRDNPALAASTFEYPLFEFEPFAFAPLRESTPPLIPMAREMGQAVKKLLKENRPSLRNRLVKPHRPRPNRMSLLIGSCQYGAGILDRQVAMSSYQQLANGLESDPGKYDLLLLLGDQVYTDATAGLFDPQSQADRFEQPHQRWLRSRSVRHVLRSLPTYMMLDDHEIIDNWEPGNPVPAGTLEDGRRAFTAFQFGGESARNKDSFWGPIESAPLPIFMLNTRTDREPRSISTWQQARIIGDDQLKALETWLQRAGNASLPKIISCASIPLPRHHPVASQPAAALHMDGFDGYPASLYALLQMIHEKEIKHVVFVSGDEHIPLGATITLTSSGRETLLHSIHTPSMYSPFTFTNGRTEDFISNDQFDLPGTDIQCAVTLHTFPRQDGFTHLLFEKTSGKWKTVVRWPGDNAELKF